jgi:hypothetical protein
LEYRTPAQVRSDLSINGIGSETAPTITNLNTLTVAGEYFIDSFVSGIVGHADEPATVKMYAADATTRAAQEAIGLTTGRKFRRIEVSGVWLDWQEFQNALGFTPVEQGGAGGMAGNKLKIGWRADGLGLQLDLNNGIYIGMSVRNSQTPAGVNAAENNSTLIAPGSPPLYAARAWVNFDGTNGAIRASGNVSSVVRNGVGDYTINFTLAMPDANYAVAGTGAIISILAISTTSCRVYTIANNTLFDPVQCHVAIFR